MPADGTGDDWRANAITTPEEIPPSKRLLRFRAYASATAFELAGLLADAPRTLLDVNVAERVLLPRADWSAIAEALLGGLLRKTRLRPDDDRAVGYEFHKGVREELLSSSCRGDTVRVARLIGNHLGTRNPIVRNISDAVADPDNTPDPAPTAETRRHIRAQEAAFRMVSVRYARRTSRLRDKSGRGDHVQPQAHSPSQAVRSLPDSSAYPPPVEELLTETQIVRRSLVPGGGQMTAPGLSQSEESGRTLARQPQIWGEVPLRNPDFVGREPLLVQLRLRLLETGGATVVLPEALHGTGSVGKSRTVVEYIYRCASEYDVVWWIPSEQPATIRSSFVALVKRLGIKSSNAETAVAVVLETLRSGVGDRRWFLVFDNAEHPDVVRPFLPTGLGHVVVTSRNADWSGVAFTVEVDLFTREESIELLRSRGDGNIADADAGHLGDALGDLLPAVEQVVSWRAQTGMPVAEYVELLDRNSAELPKAGGIGEYELPVAAAWNVPLNRLKTDRRGALELLEVCAVFSPEPIFRSLFTGVRGAPVPQALVETFGDAIKPSQAIREKNRDSLAKVTNTRPKPRSRRQAMTR